MKFHINHRGEIKECKVKKDCKYEEHFDSYKLAQDFAEEKLCLELENLHKMIDDKSTQSKICKIEEITGLISEIENKNKCKKIDERNILISIAEDIKKDIPRISWYSKTPTKDEEKELKNKIVFFQKRKSSYFNRMKSCEKIKKLDLDLCKTYHYKIERKKKIDKMTENFDKGEVIGYYKVNHILNTENDKEEYVVQIVELRNNGRSVIYDVEGDIVTTFIAGYSRIEAYIVKSGEIPNEDFLNLVRLNKAIAILLKIEN